MKTYEYFKKYHNKDDNWIERNIEGLCGDCEMIMAPEYDDHSKAYIVDGDILHICDKSLHSIESLDSDGNVMESWSLEE